MLEEHAPMPVSGREQAASAKPAERVAHRTSGDLSRRTFFGLAGGAMAAGLLGTGTGTPLQASGKDAGRGEPDEERLHGTGFLEARPVWLDGREREMNLMAGFRAVFALEDVSEEVTLRITGSSVYRLYLNGQFVGYGPARGPHGYYRVDAWRLPPALLEPENLLAVEVAAYNVNTYYLLNQPAFLQAEVVAGSRVLAATGGAGAAFQAAAVREKVQKVQRYSFQRTFVEVYRLGAAYGHWRTHRAAPSPGERLAMLPEQPLLPRRVPYPDFFVRAPKTHVAAGTVRQVEVDEPWRDRALTGVGPAFLGFPEEQLDVVLSLQLQGIARRSSAPDVRPYTRQEGVELAADAFRIVDFGTNLSGFVGVDVTARQPTRLYLVFDEILSDGDVDFKRLSCVNAVLLELQPGTHRFESFEPYTLRYLKLMSLDGPCSVTDLYLREYAAPDVYEAHFAAADPRLNRLFEAGRETYRQNAVDVFTDCPSRERAGWLCDSFFTARTAAGLSRSLALERNFFENYALPAHFDFLPDGMLPMCYPADHNDGVFIPNWSLWFVLQLEEYLQRTGDRETVEVLEERIRKLFAYFERFRNEDGLLEKLEGWVFVEWSEANAFVQDVNYPSNMLFAAALAAAGRLYDRPELAAEAARIRDVIRSQSFDGAFFVDNAVRRNATLEVTRNRTEVCQYFAFYFGVASPDTHPALWERLRDHFGPGRRETKAFADVHPANAFVGNILRLELLSRNGLGRQILDESVATLLYMAERTGTLWEHIDVQASCNHGFASHIIHTLYRDVLGCYRVDVEAREVLLRFTEVDLPWCEGRMSCPGGFVQLRWEKRDGRLRYVVDVPAGYAVTVDNRSGLALTAG